MAWYFQPTGEKGTVEARPPGTSDVYTIRQEGVPTRFVCYVNGERIGISGPVWGDVHHAFVKWIGENR